MLEKNGTVYVRVKYRGVPEFPAYRSVMENGEPDWVKKYAADIPGFLTGIGVSKNKGSTQKTYQASYEDAIVSLLPGLSTQVGGGIVDAAGARMTTNITVSRGSLVHAVILETWLDRKTGAVWTLLAAQPKPE
jgi:hypothetical protein